MWNLFKKLFWERDIFKRGKKLGIEPQGPDAIDYETFCKRVNDSENALRSRQNTIICTVSLLVSIVSLVISLLK